MHKARDSSAYGLSPCITIREGIEAFLLYQRSVRKNDGRTLAGHRHALELLASMLGGSAGDIAIDRITIDDIDAAIARLGQGLKPGTVNKLLASLRRFASWAIKKHRVPPGVRLDWLEFERVHIPRRTVKHLTKHEFRSIMRDWPQGGQHVARVLWLMAVTGARPEAILSLRWADIHRERHGGGFIRFKPLKGGNLVAVPFRESDLVGSILRDAAAFYRRTRGCGRIASHVRVFVPNRRGLAHDAWSLSAFCNAVRFHADRIGAEGFTAYSVRHSVLTWLARDGVSDDERKNFAGHTTTAMQAVYIHTSGADAHGVRETVSEWFGDTYARAVADAPVSQFSDARQPPSALPDPVGGKGGLLVLQPIRVDADTE